ncbi:hypothetical protein HFU97_06925 [Acidithiobacillus sp. BN09-2]|nr:hypothetical protein [Acidithiobacillus sp. BN09-2]
MILLGEEEGLVAMGTEVRCPNGRLPAKTGRSTKHYSVLKANHFGKDRIDYLQEEL